MSTTHTADRDKGMSLARVPALILGTVLLVAGLYFLYREHGFAPLSSFPNRTVHTDGKAFGVFGLNGWSGELTAAAGGLLLIGAAQHLLAKGVSLIVGVVLVVVAIWALVHHHSALGLFAANIWTILLWIAAGALLLINTLLPRTPAMTHTETRDPYRPAGAPTAVPARTAVATEPSAGLPTAPAAADTTTIIPERAAVRVRPTDDAVHDNGMSPS